MISATIDHRYGVSLTAIGRFAFSGCKSLESVTVPRYVTYISYAAFRGCTSLTDVTIANGVRIIGEGAFKGCKSLENVVVPRTVTEIGNGAFAGCKNLKIQYDDTKSQWNEIQGDKPKVTVQCTDGDITN